MGKGLGARYMLPSKHPRVQRRDKCSPSILTKKMKPSSWILCLYRYERFRRFQVVCPVSSVQAASFPRPSRLHLPGRHPFMPSSLLVVPDELYTTIKSFKVSKALRTLGKVGTLRRGRRPTWMTKSGPQGNEGVRARSPLNY